MHVSLIVPAPFDAVSGGYAYDRRIVAGLREAGHSVACGGTRRRVSADGRSRARCRPRRMGQHCGRPRGRSSMASHCRPSPGSEDALAARNAVGLIHHPTALETGFSEAERAALLAHREAPAAAARACHRHQRTDRRRLAADFGVERDRIRVVVPGTDDAPRSTGSGGPTCHILSIGTLVPRKGHDLLLRALARLFDLDWRLTIVGSPDRDPVHAHALAALADELGSPPRANLPAR